MRRRRRQEIRAFARPHRGSGFASQRLDMDIADVNFQILRNFGAVISRAYRRRGLSIDARRAARPSRIDVEEFMASGKRKERPRDEAIAWVGGRPVDLDEAAATAARLLRASRLPLFADIGLDVNGMRASIALAERVGGVIEHPQSQALLRDLDVVRESGAFLTTPGEARVRADVVLVIGDDVERVRAVGRLGPPKAARRILQLEPSDVVIAAKAAISEPQAAHLGRWDDALETYAFPRGPQRAARLAALRARAKGRRVHDANLVELDRIASVLRNAKYGVAVWSPLDLGPLEIETVVGLVRDLNEVTRFTALPSAESGAGALAVCGWMTGFPMRTRLSAEGPVHDSWRYDGTRLLGAGETDCVIWVAGDDAPPPAWASSSSAIALCGRKAEFAVEPKVRIVIGRPGRDHDATLFNPDVATFVAVTAKRPNASTPTAAAALALIASHLDDGGVWPC